MKRFSLLPILFMLLFIKDANTKQPAEETKPVVIYFYTDWCAYCGMQRKQIKKDSTLNSLLQRKFSFMEFNAESRQEITFNGRTYSPQKSGVHSFVYSFFKTGKYTAYPAWVILDKNHQVAFSHQGLIKSEELKKILYSKQVKSSSK